MVRSNGTGKTLMAKTIARNVKMFLWPLVDATVLTEAVT